MKNKLAFNLQKIESEGDAPGEAQLEIIMAGIVGDWGMDAKTICTQIQQSKADSITLRINSYGGDIFDGIAICNYLRSEKRPVTAVIDGLAASAATIIACGASNIIMPKGSLWMIHNPWSCTAGDGDAMRKSAEVLDKIAAQCAGLYAERTGKTPEEMTALMKEETWLDGAEAVAAGFADIAEDSEDVAASLDFSNLSDAVKVKAEAKIKELQAKAEAKRKEAGTKAAANESQQPAASSTPPAANANAGERQGEERKPEAVNAELTKAQAELATVNAELANLAASFADYKAKAEAAQAKLKIDFDAQTEALSKANGELAKYKATVSGVSFIEKPENLEGYEAYLAKMKAKYA